MTDRELMQMALDALNNFDKGNHGMRWQVPIIKALRSRLANEFNPDWNQVEALQESLREHMAEIQRLRAALAQPEQEPVAWVYQHGDTGLTMCVLVQQVESGFEKNNPSWQKSTPLYTAPPQREVYCGCGDEIVAGDGARCGTCVAVKYKEKEWQGLTDKEIENCFEMSMFGTCRAIEAMLKEKNGD